MAFKSKESRSTRVRRPMAPMTDFQKRLVNDAFAVLLPIAQKQLDQQYPTSTTKTQPK